jgi:pimeloyl-ACP methyl ester carboxylesterase
MSASVSAFETKTSGPQFAELATYGGEDIASAAVLRQHFAIPEDDCHALTDGVTWARRLGPQTNNKLPIILCAGASGCAMFYKAMAERLAEFYDGPVVIVDRYGIGLSDRVAGQRNDLDLWSRQLDELVKSLGYEQAHFMGSSFGCAVLVYFESKFPARVASLGFISACIGGAGPKAAFQKVKIIKKLAACCCCLTQVVLTKKFAVKKLYARCDGQVEEGADAVGLPIAKAMYRVKGTAKAWADQMLSKGQFEVHRDGLFDKFEGLASRDVPMSVPW